MLVTKAAGATFQPYWRHSVQGQGWHVAFLSSLTLLLSYAPSPRVSSPTGEATHVPTSYLLGEASQEK